MSPTKVRLIRGPLKESVVTKLSNKFARAGKRVISLVSATAIAVTGLVAAAVAPASATSAPVIKSFGYMVNLSTPSSPVSVVGATYKRIDFQSNFKYDDVTSLRGHVLTVDSVETGFTSANKPIVYAYFTFADANNQTVGTGSQINPVFNNQAVDDHNSITIPEDAVKMNIGWTTAANISDAGNGPVPAGTYSSTPKLFDRGTSASPIDPTEISYTSESDSTAGLYYQDGRNYATIDGIGTAMNLPATGTIRQSSVTLAGCVDWSKVSSSTIATTDFKVNGQAPNYFNVSTSDATETYRGNPVSGSTLDFSAGSLATWRSESKPIYVFASLQQDSSLNVNGMAIDATLDVVDANNVSILKNCTPATPTGTGTLGAGTMSGRLLLTPTTFVPPSGEWSCNLYKKSDNSLVATGSGWGSTGCMLGSFDPSIPAIPTGVPLYAKIVSKIKILGQSLSAVGATASNDYTMTSGGGGNCAPACGPAPAPPAGFIPPKVLWPSTKAMAVGTKLTAVKSNIAGSRKYNWVRCASTYARPAGTIINYMAGQNVFLHSSCELLTTQGWVASSLVAVPNSTYTVSAAATYTVTSADARKSIYIIDFAANPGPSTLVAVSKTVKISDKTEPNIPVTAPTLKKGKTLKIANLNSQKLAVVVTSTTTSKCTVAKVGTSYVVTGKALGTCLIKLAVTGKGFVATANEIHAITIN